MRSRTKRSIAAILATTALVALMAGCTGGEPQGEPSDGQTFDEPPVGESYEPMPPEYPEPVYLTDLREPYTFDNGVTFANIKIKTDHLTAKEAQIENRYWSKKVVKPGDGMVTFTFQLKNEGTEPSSAVEPEFVYGPNDEQPVKVSDAKDSKYINGPVLPGRQGTGWETYAIPEEHWDDVRVEVLLDSEHPTLIYSGSVR